MARESISAALATPLYANPSRNIVIEDNVVYDGGNDGIKIHQSDNIHVIGNTVRNSGDDNIDFVAVNNSVIADNDVGGSHGISCDPGQGRQYRCPHRSQPRP